MHKLYHNLTLTGHVTEILSDGLPHFKIACRSGDTFYVHVNTETNWASLVNLDKISRDRYGNPANFDWSPKAKIQKYLAPGLLVVVEGVFVNNALARYLDARTVRLLYDMDDQKVTDGHQHHFLFEDHLWWVDQVSFVADRYLNALFGPGDTGEYNWTKYRTQLGFVFNKEKSEKQEMATMSRMIYGFASAYLMTGNHRYLKAASSGVQYQRDHFRIISADGKSVNWAYAKDGVDVIIPSQDGDDANTIPLYEQIYALAGLTQYYRITLDWETFLDIKRTVHYMIEKFRDPSEYGGYFSHLDYATGSPKVSSLGKNRAKKNWNSIGDHIPAYLVNLILALEPIPDSFRNEQLEEFLTVCKNLLDETTNLIIKHFPDFDNSPFVNERFFEDWTPDHTYSWQKNRGIVGHNLKIAWNLTRVANYYEKTDPEKANKIVELAEKIAQKMIDVGAVDLFRGGCYDCVERKVRSDGTIEFAWMNTKDFWQQEQAILAFLILYGYTKKQLYIDLAREMMAFWNVFFLDTDNGGVYFRTTDDGFPVPKGQYATKGGHAYGYHVEELCYLSHIYIQSYVRKHDFLMHFKPSSSRVVQESINVLPDFIKPGSVEIASVNINGIESPPGHKFKDFKVPLPKGTNDVEVIVHFKPVGNPWTPLIPLPAVIKGKVGLYVETHYDEHEADEFERVLKKHGYEVVYVSNLWDQPYIEFAGNDFCNPIRARVDFNSITDEVIDSWNGFILLGGIAMDRLRYESNPDKDQPNISKACKFTRTILAHPKVKVGIIDHSAWMLTAADVIKGRKVTCTHSMIYDIEKAGGDVQFGDDGTVDVFVDGNLVSGKDAKNATQFIEEFIKQMEKTD